MFTDYWYVKRCLIALTVREAIPHLKYAIDRLSEQGYTGQYSVYTCVWGQIFMSNQIFTAEWEKQGFPPPPRVEVNGKLEPIPTWKILRAEITDPIVRETAAKLLEQEINAHKSLKEQILELKMWVDIVMHDTFLDILRGVLAILLNHDGEVDIIDLDKCYSLNRYTEEDHAEARRKCDNLPTVEMKRQHFQSVLDTVEF